MTSLATRPGPSGPRTRDPAWRKAPSALARTPGILAAIAGAAFLLGAAAASGPLYLSSAEVATLQAEVAVLDPVDAGLTVELPLVPEAAVLDIVSDALEAERARALPELGPAVRRIRSTPISLDVEGQDSLRVRLFASEERGAADGVQSGLVVPPGLLPVAVGDEVRLVHGGDEAIAPVREIASVPGVGELPEVGGSFTAVADLAAALDVTATVTWAFPLSDADAVDVAPLARRLRSVSAAITDQRTSLGSTVTDAAEFRTRVVAGSALPDAARRTAVTVAALTPPVRSLWAASFAICLAVVGGAAVLRVRRRRREHAILAARGVTPTSQALRSALECAGGVVVGSAAGFGAVVLLIRAVGPGGLAVEALPRASIATGAAALVALLVVGLVTGAVMRGTHVAAARVRTTVARMPLEVVPIALAVLTYTRMRGGPTAAARAGIDPLVLAFPALALIGCVALLARLLGGSVTVLRRRGASASPAILLAMRRLATSPGATMTLVALTAIAVGLAASAATIATSADVTARTKAEVAVGAPAAGPLGHGEPGPMPAGSTLVGRTQADARPGPGRVDVLAVDLATIAEVAAWTPGLADRPLSALLEELDAPTSGLPILMVDPAGPGAPVSVLTGRRFSLPVTVTGHVRAFPGMPSGQPMAVVSLERFEAAVAEDGGLPAWQVLDMEVWAGGQADQAADRVVQAGAVPSEVRTVHAETAVAPLRAAGWALAYLQAAAGVAALLAGVTLALALGERQRTMEVSYVLARRMGLTRRAHRRAVAVELGGLLGTALALGMGLGIAAAAIAAPWTDPFPGRPPGPMFALPWGALGTALVLSAALVLVGSALVQRHVDRVRMGQVLRAAD